MLIDIEIVSKQVETKIRNKYTNGKFLTIKEYDKLIRKKKIKRLLK